MSPKSHDNIFNIIADTVCTTFRKAVKECNIIDLAFYDSRHKACTRLAQKLAVLDLVKMIEHRDIKSLFIIIQQLQSWRIGWVEIELE